MRITFKYLFTSVLLSLFFMQTANANLLISPTRIVLDDRDRSAHVTLVNNSSERKTYRIELVENVQTSDGAYVRIESGQDKQNLMSALDMLRHSPRQVTLEAGENQRVRLNVRKPANLPRGEYRVHMAFTELPPPQRLEQTEGTQITLHMLMTFTIPVIIRNGEVAVSASILNPRLVSDAQNNNYGILFDIKKEGLFSVFGEVMVHWRPNQNSSFKRVARIANIAVFRELNLRENVAIRIPKEDLKAGFYKIEYRGGTLFQNQIFDQHEVYLEP